MDLETASELNGYRTDKVNFPKERERYASRMAFLLRGEMGEDIKNVINGKVKVKLSWREKLKYKFNYFINKLFSIF